MTKSRKEYLKTQRLYKQVIFWVALSCAIVMVSVWNHYSLEYNKVASQAIESIKSNIHVQKVKAETVRQEVQTKKVVLAIPEAKESVEQMIRRIAKEECDKQKLGDYCVDDLAAIGYTESRFDCSVIGDGGKSFGCFQIHRGWHPDVSVAQAKDLKFAINWTLNRMVHYGYPTMRSYSIMKHNGTPGTVKTKAYLATVNNFLKK